MQTAMLATPVAAKADISENNIHIHLTSVIAENYRSLCVLPRLLPKTSLIANGKCMHLWPYFESITAELFRLI